MEQLLMKKPKQVIWNYDQGADVLYLSFGEPQKALTMDLGSGVLARYVDGKIVGFTLIGLKEVLKLRQKVSAA